MKEYFSGQKIPQLYICRGCHYNKQFLLRFLPLLRTTQVITQQLANFDHKEIATSYVKSPNF